MMKSLLIKIFLFVFFYQHVESSISHRKPQLITIENVHNKINYNTIENEHDDVEHNHEKNTKYEPTWDSLDSRPLPQWYDDAKIGIFLHFGVYAAIPYGSEWFWYNWKMDKVPSYIEFMQRTQKPDFTYQDFASQFTCELFNATEWAEIFADSGAKYVVLTSKHHEGFTLYPSTYSFSWNSMDVGPNRNIIKELSEAVREKSLKFGIYYSLFEWFNRMYIDDKFHGFLQKNYVNHKMFPELQEIVKLFRPEVIWSDGEWEAPDEYWRAKEFLAWLYNDSPVHETVVANDRWGISTLCKHGDVYTCTDRYNPGVLQKHKFENAMTIDKKSWGHRDDAKLGDFFSSEELIKEIVSTIAINGNILINVGPTKYGTIEAIFADRLRDMGKWLRINGKGIYGSRPWAYQKDGNTTWFTMKNGETRDSVFIFVTEYPYDTNTITVGKVGKFMDKSSKIFMVGYNEELEFQFVNSSNELEIKFPDKRFIDKAGLFAVWTLEVDIQKKKKFTP